MKKRASGILLHISSLPGEYGIGDLGQGAYKFLDFLKSSRQEYWQILPIGMTGAGDSPYQSFSAFAGNPCFIDLEELIKLKLLSDHEVNRLDFGNSQKVDYKKVQESKMYLLKKAYSRCTKVLKSELNTFYEESRSWLRDFALFMTIKGRNTTMWIQWDNSFKNNQSKEVLDFEKDNQEGIFFWVFTQYFFYKQWKRLKKAANNKGIKIIGDLPIYVSLDSSDCWADPILFNLNKGYKPVTVAGSPPDAFSKTGQLWGNPIYNWNNMKSTRYRWWIKRIKHSFDLFDTLRMDHFRGFEAYWEVPYGSIDATNGRWIKGPGMELFKAISDSLGNLDIIAEDLGYYTESLRAFIDKAGFPDMRVLQFAFDGQLDNPHIPANYTRNSVAYTGTHDNSTILGWLNNADEKTKANINAYFNNSKDEFHWKCIKEVWSSAAYLSIAPMQDFLGLGDEARMNIPSTIGDNWDWRVDKSALTENLAEKISEITVFYNRD